MSGLAERIEREAGLPDDALGPQTRAAFAELIAALESGEARAAEPDGAGGWRVNPWVKKGILLGFRIGRLRVWDQGAGLRFFDRDTFPLRSFPAAGAPRLVPGGSAIRCGTYVGARTTFMPPCYVNVGAWIGEDTMVDSHALVGSCAQVGRRVHVSAGSQIGGVLEPVGALPVIIEDEALVGGNCGLYEGTIVRRRAVIGAGTILTRSTPVYDAVRERVLRAGDGRPLEVPEGAVVVPGSRPARGRWAEAQGLHLATPVIVKYRDEKTDASSALEEALR